MSDQDAADLALVVLRCGLGAALIAHGHNHLFGDVLAPPGATPPATS